VIGSKTKVVRNLGSVLAGIISECYFVYLQRKETIKAEISVKKNISENTEKCFSIMVSLRVY